VPRVVSFFVLLAVLLLIGTIFFQVMVQFVVPLFLATVLVVVFKPLHQWLVRHLPGKPKVAALLTTLTILSMVLLPTVLLGAKAYSESRALVDFLEDEQRRQSVVEAVQQRGGKLLEFYEEKTGAPLDTKTLIERAAKSVGSVVLSSFQAFVRILIGLAIMMLALYYFFLDGPGMIATLMRLSPLDDVYERELLDKFANVSRAVVVASVLSAIVQGLLAGIGYYFALADGAPIILLMVATMVLAIVPFVGAAAVWIPTCVVVFCFQPVEVGGELVRGDTVRAIALAVYCAGVVSTIDNFIKPYVLHGQSNLHPLLALISVLGGVQVLGPLGILVGPMLVAFVQALLVMINKELRLLSSEGPDSGVQAVGDQLALRQASDNPSGAAMSHLLPQSNAHANPPRSSSQRPSPSAAQPSSKPNTKGKSRKSRRRK
jgi:predicted PurR-regulated permease PerM